MNKYTYVFNRACPNNGLIIQYVLIIESPNVLMVESIIEEVENLPGTGFHEGFADTLTRVLPGFQTLMAHHHGVDIETTRGGA